MTTSGSASPTRARDDASTRRDAEPHTLVNAGRRWYLVAWDCGREAGARSASIASRARPPSGRFTPRALPGGDPAAFVERSLRTAPQRYQARVTVRAPAAELRRRRWLGGTVEPIDDGSCEYRTADDNLDWLAMRVAMLGAGYVVHEPPELVDRLRELAAGIMGATAVHGVLRPAPRAELIGLHSAACRATSPLAARPPASRRPSKVKMRLDETGNWVPIVLDIDTVETTEPAERPPAPDDPRPPACASRTPASRAAARATRRPCRRASSRAGSPAPSPSRRAACPAEPRISITSWARTSAGSTTWSTSTPAAAAERARRARPPTRSAPSRRCRPRPARPARRAAGRRATTSRTSV